ncbi:hypothetical protein A7985_04135 [Pseudoalteromonas luteoviolacea]|uniref:PsbP C-terminal domain-containing protein n=1 Tax=Pseudoalteromonas luteoviolacea TaxID=43657 RepID=A0A1C0TUZ8_9GAMM|nr:hypothetical protein [Pseudoalteromonas luteoviolacea]OCQ23147.1 hypothetical protein A7985_04135 [Pseudoalteromonas luteoviolacea]
MLKAFTVILLLLTLTSCGKEEKVANKKSYLFSPIGWQFQLPEYWKSQKGFNIDKTLEKYGNQMGISDADKENFQNQKVFMLETKEGFNKFTSEVTSFSGSEVEFINGTSTYKKQMLSQLKALSPQVEVKSGEINQLTIDGKQFNVFDAKFRFSQNKDEYFYMEVYMGLVKDSILVTSYTCIYGTTECETIKKAFESSRFNKI